MWGRIIYAIEKSSGMIVVMVMRLYYLVDITSICSSILCGRSRIGHSVFA